MCRTTLSEIHFDARLESRILMASDKKILVLIIYRTFPAGRKNIERDRRSWIKKETNFSSVTSIRTHVGKYDRANDRPKLAVLAIDIGPMIDRSLDDNCGHISACYIGPKIARDFRPRITARVEPKTYQIYNDINDDNKIWHLAYNT